MVNHTDRSGKGLTQDQLNSTEVSQSSPAPTELGDQELKNGENVKGVVRLLKEGHFKGVADVRLRINFFDELITTERRELQAVATEKVTGIVKSVGMSVEELLLSDELTEEKAAAVSEHRETFAQSVNQLKENFLNSDEPSKDALISGLKMAFEEVVTSITLALSTTTADSSGDGLTPVDMAVGETAPIDPATEESDGMLEPAQTSESEDDLQVFIVTLRSAFTTALNELINGLNEVKALPELSEPEGNGMAFDKFLAIYNELQGIETPGEGSANGQTLDTVT